MIKNSLRIAFFSVLMVSCTSEITQHNTVEDNQANDTVIKVEKEPETKIVEELSTETKTYNGSWFKIEYPADFISYPTEPVVTENEITYVETDEAYFSSPNGDVEFFVYSPQWNGEPENYLMLADNEKIVSEEDAVDEIMPSTNFKWVTIEDKNGAYSRSYYSKHTESTHLVFGIKYKNQEVYDAYKAQYKAFKKSLVQYAD